MKHYAVKYRPKPFPVRLFFLIAATLAVLLSPVVTSTQVSAQSTGNEVKPFFDTALVFAESPTIDELPPAKGSSRFEPPPAALAEPGSAGADPAFELPMLPLPKAEAASADLPSLQAEDPAALADETEAGVLSMPTPIANFEGLSNQDNFDAFGFRLSPPDTNGDVGPNHYVEQTNLLVRVFDKSGTPLTAPFKLSSLFAPLGGQCAAADQGDPIVMYDPLADRWLLSQFAFVALSTPPYHECIAVSKTGDPTGEYYLYDFVTPGNEFPDYPKIGVWPDAYYMTVNQFTSGGPFNGTGAYAFDRKKMLAGDPTASFIYFNLNLAAHPEAIGGMLPSDFDGLTPPPAGRPNTFAYFLADEFLDPIDGLRLFDFHADFANPLNSSFTERAESPVAVDPFNPNTPAGRRDIVQPPPATTTNALDSISDRLMHRLQYRNLGGTESLVVNHTVNVSGSTTVGTYRSGVRYYQLTQSGGGAFMVAEQATFDPADGNSRWMGSAAIDHQGNLAVGYSVSGLTTFPSIRYAGRLATDPPGGLFQGEATLVDGSGVQLSTTSRWGDYSALMVDPADECTFWYTQEYYTAASQATSPVGWLTRIGSFKFDACTPAARGTLQGTVTDAQTSAAVEGALVEISGGFSDSTDASGNYSRDVAPGTYSVTVSKFGYETATVDGAVVTDGNITTVDVQLTPIPIIFPHASALVSEEFSPPNGIIDPGETVTVDFTLRNDGAGATSNLVATLLETGGVTNSSGSQSYGVVPGSGGTGTQPFTFRADPALGCGGTLVATLQLQDGARDLGTATFTFTLGDPRIALAENFDGVTAPALPAGWTTTVATGTATNAWVTSTTTPDTAPNAAFAPDPATVHDIRLDSPSFPVLTSSAQVTFRNNYNLEPGFDGGVLEISINGGPFADIIAAGGSFASGGYNRAISASFSSPIAGRQAWSANSNGYLTTQVNLPASAAGATVQLRWRLATDRSVAGAGWRVDGISVNDGFLCAFNIVPAGSAITAESFSPVNGVIDPGEKVTVDFTLRNDGTSPTTDLVATLLETGGVVDPSGPQPYGALAATGGTGTRPFTFRADPALECGGTLVATLQLQDGTRDLGTATFTFTLGVPRVALSENFDGVTAPALPAGWTSTVAAGDPALNWITVTTTPDTPPNAAFAADPAGTQDTYLDTPPIAIQSSSAQVTFRNNYNLEAGFDGGVLEISMDGGATFADIIAAGGSFVSGGYNRTISTAFGSPIAGRQAWSANSNGYLTTRVNLPASAAGATVQLRWRMAADRSVSGVGWRVDSITIDDGFECAANAAPVVTVDPASQSVQYSDPIAPVSIAAADASLDTPLAIATQWSVDSGAFTPGLPEWLTLTSDGCATSGNSGRCAWTLAGNALTAPGTYLVRVTVSDDSGGSTDADITIVVTQEDARATYTGALSASTGSTSISTAMVTLAATIQDITAVDPSGDAAPGDIRNASISFVNRDAGDAVLCTAPIGLVDEADTKTGTATCTWTADLGSARSLSVRVGLVVGNYYTRNSPDEDATVNIKKARLGDLVIGAGHLVLSDSAGMKAGDAGSKSVFAFTVIQTRSGSRPASAFLLTVHRTEADGRHTYLIEGTASSLAVQDGPDTATFNGSVRILDITNPHSPVVVDGDAALQVTVDDNGHRSSNDEIGITVWNRSGGLWFASKWNGTSTVEQSLASGNIIVP